VLLSCPSLLPELQLQPDQAAEWRTAEHAWQAERRHLELVQQQLQSKGVTASERRRTAYATPLSAVQLRAELAATERRLESLRRAADVFVPPSLARPLLSALPPHSVRSVNVSFILQYYKQPTRLAPLVQRLHGCLPAWAVAGLTAELLVNVDSRGDAASWEAAQLTSGAFLTVIHSHNLHELGGYNRGAALARGRLLVMLQDDELPPAGDCAWLPPLLAPFALRPQLGALTQRGGYYWFPEELGRAGALQHMRAPDSGPRFADPALSGAPFEWLSTFAFAPVAFRAAAFAAVGGLDESFAPLPGDCGIYADSEMSLRLWAAGWQVAHVGPVFERAAEHEGGTKKGAAAAQCRMRQARLNYAAAVRRFPEPFTRQVAERVAALNSNLTRRFHDGPAPWEYSRADGGLGFNPPGKMREDA
jgi:GT2 family glycosyltransferase